MKQQPVNDTKNVKPTDVDNDMRPSFYDTLKQKRDELKLQSHLFSKEAQSSWTELEGDWNRLSTSMKERQNELKDTSSKVYSEFKKMAEDIKHRYDKFKQDIKH